MSEPFIGEVKLFAGNFEPPGWMICDGRLLAISEHLALFEVIGTTYGGDGRTTFALPNLRGRVAMGKGAGPGLTNRRMGELGGMENVTLSVDQLASHEHALRATNNLAAETAPAGNVLAQFKMPQYLGAATSVVMGADSIGATGNNAPIPNIQPFLVLNFIIAIVGHSPRDEVRIIRAVSG